MPRSGLACVALLIVLLCAHPACGLEHFSNDDASLPAAIDAFQKWFEAGYGPGLGVRLGPAGDGMRMGVFATRNFSAEKPYLSIPLKLIIDEATIFPTPRVGPIIREAQRHVPQRWIAQVTLGLFLLHQRFVDAERSAWKPYIDLLPTDHDSPAYYTEAELEPLKGLPIVGSARHVSNEMTDVFRIASRAVAQVRGADEHFPSWALNEANWRWVQGILNTRMIWWDSGPHLVPMLDMINCRQGPPGFERRVHSTTRLGDRAVTYAPWAFREGDQVFENYGQPNPTYFLYHGFAMEPNVHDCAKATWVSTNKQGAIVSVKEERRRRAAELGVWENEYCLSPSSQHLSKFLGTARVLTATSNVPKTLQQATSPLTNGGEERRALAHAVRAIRKQLSALAPVPWGPCESSLSACREAWMRTDEWKNMPFRRRMAITFRETQRELLTRTLKHLQRARKAIPKPAQPKRPPPSGDGNADL